MERGTSASKYEKFVHTRVPKKYFLQLVNLLLTFSWTFIDLLIMLLSTAMSLRFMQVTARLRSVAEAKVRDVFFRSYKNSSASSRSLPKMFGGI